MINICFVQANFHARIFEDMVAMLSGALNELGHPTTVSINKYKEGEMNILIGNLLATQQVKKIVKHPYFIYQLEPLHDTLGPMHEFDYRDYEYLLNNAEYIFDYSPLNMDYYKRHGIKNVALLPPAFHHSLPSFEQKEKDIDVLFFGTPTERRKKLLDTLSKDMKTVCLFEFYGKERNDMIARSKIILNVHGNEGLKNLEVLRLLLLLTNGCFVISERGEYSPFEGIVYADYADIPNVCLEYLDNSEERNRIAKLGFESIKEVKFVDNLKLVWNTKLWN